MPIVMKGGMGASRGFTLVEMSIVLVIIGLIIGGILKGQEIIASARSKAVVNQVNAVRAASNTYFDRYRALPGDDAAGTEVSTMLTNGNGTGIVGDAIDGTDRETLADANASGSADSENYEYFNALIATNLLNGGAVTVSTVTSATSFGQQALPAAPISGAGMTVYYGTVPGNGTGATSRTGHWLRVHKTVGAPAAALSPRALAAIDNQVDDGRSGNGGVQGVDDTGAAATCDNSGTYAVGDDVTCIAVFEQ